MQLVAATRSNRVKLENLFIKLSSGDFAITNVTCSFRCSNVAIFGIQILSAYQIEFDPHTGPFHHSGELPNSWIVQPRDIKSAGFSLVPI